MSPRPFVNYTGFPYPSQKFQNLPPDVQTHLPLMFPHLLHLIHLSNPDELYDLHLNLILLSHESIRKFGNSAFAFAGPDEWNKLPVFIRKSSSLPLFKTNLKTYSNCVIIRHFSVTRFVQDCFCLGAL